MRYLQSWLAFFSSLGPWLKFHLIPLKEIPYKSPGFTERLAAAGVSPEMFAEQVMKEGSTSSILSGLLSDEPLYIPAVGTRPAAEARLRASLQIPVFKTTQAPILTHLDLITDERESQ